MIGKLSVKTSLLSLFSEAVKIEMNGIYILLGPTSDNFSDEKDFSQDPKNAFYDLKDQIANLVMMHEIVEEHRKPQKLLLSKKKAEMKLERKIERDKRRAEIERKRQDDERLKRVNP